MASVGAALPSQHPRLYDYYDLAVLPALANEFIVLLKETSVASFVSVADLTYAGNIIGGNSYDYLFPLLMTAVIYLALVMFFTHLVGKLERRLRNSER